MWSIKIYALLDGDELLAILTSTRRYQSPLSPTMVFPHLQPFKSGKDKITLFLAVSSVQSRHTLQLIVSTAKTVADIWRILEATYVKPGMGHIQQLKIQMKNWTKSTNIIDEYIQGFTTWFDQLALLSKPVEHEDKIEYILGRLPEEYKQFVDQVEGRDVTPSVSKVHEKLINKEAKILTNISDVVSLAVTTNVASTHQQRKSTQYQRPSQPWNRNEKTYMNNHNNTNNKFSKGYIKVAASSVVFKAIVPKGALNSKIATPLLTLTCLTPNRSSFGKKPIKLVLPAAKYYDFKRPHFLYWRLAI